MKLTPRELMLFAELWTTLRVPGGPAAKIMQSEITRLHRNKRKGKKSRLRATSGR